MIKKQSTYLNVKYEDFCSLGLTVEVPEKKGKSIECLFVQQSISNYTARAVVLLPVDASSAVRTSARPTRFSTFTVVSVVI